MRRALRTVIKMHETTLPALIAGYGANSRECASIIRACNMQEKAQRYRLLGYIGRAQSDVGTHGDTDVVCSDETLESYVRAYPKVAIFIPIGDPAVKQQLKEKYSNQPNVLFPTLIHPTAIFMDADSVKFGQGCIVSAGSVISISVTLGDFVYVNYGALIGHDTSIGDFCLINPNATISGSVCIGRDVIVGAASCIRQGLSVGNGSVIGMGACIVKDVLPESIMITKLPTIDMRKDVLL